MFIHSVAVTGIFLDPTWCGILYKVFISTIYCFLKQKTKTKCFICRQVISNSRNFELFLLPLSDSKSNWIRFSFYFYQVLMQYRGVFNSRSIVHFSGCIVALDRLYFSPKLVNSSVQLISHQHVVRLLEKLHASLQNISLFLIELSYIGVNK